MTYCHTLPPAQNKWQPSEVHCLQEGYQIQHWIPQAKISSESHVLFGNDSLFQYEMKTDNTNYFDTAG